ncbi:MAG: hypothetical protein LIO37_02535 [Clostridiales bacterium]|nr:hypothetical protein [Clostridiales bacterium]
MKKKLVSTLMGLVLVLSMTTAVHATTVDQDSNSNSADTKITTSIDPTYVVTIPADTTIRFEATSTSIGSVELTEAQLEPGYEVTVTASAGTLANDADATKSIAYTLEDASGVFTSASYTTEGESTALTVNITADEWDAAYAGSYEGTITFTVSYAVAD